MHAPSSPPLMSWEWTSQYHTSTTATRFGNKSPPRSPRRLQSPTETEPGGTPPSARSHQGLGTQRAVSLDRLIVRKGASLKSPKVGHLPLGRAILVLEEITLEDGLTVRSRVAQESSPRGVAVEHIGWITSTRPGIYGPETKLQPIADGEEYTSPDSSPEISLASRIAKNRVARRSHRQRNSQFSPAASPRSGGQQWLSSDAVIELAKAHWSSADALELKTFPAVEERLGHILMTLNVNEEAVFDQWDTDGNGELDLAEFRELVRTIGQLDQKLAEHSSLLKSSSCPDADVDRLFHALDIDGSGSLEVRELKIAFSKLRAALRRERYTSPAKKVQEQREAAEKIQALAPLVAAYEAEEKVLARLRGGTVNSRLGELLKVQRVDVNDLKAKWDAE